MATNLRKRKIRCESKEEEEIYEKKMKNEARTPLNLNQNIDFYAENLKKDDKFESNEEFLIAKGQTEFVAEYSYCGTDDKTRNYIFGTMWSGTEESLSFCCAKHDDCYDNHLGKDRCDLKFKSCVKSATNFIRAGAFYRAVYFLGFSAYENADSNEGPIYQFTDEKLYAQFNMVRNSCPQHKHAFSSCVIQFELCSNRGTQNCAEKLAENLSNLQNHRISECSQTIASFITNNLN
ncbi:unnamed protein product [Caenorhabditis angaria]|uniref:Uncharacterized protein n=1 Tax=Caenorhabditis angaria TaxID=860376 RepID=A0A9P1MU13_9PELO|nr:unnamed protein product [Caenorhabditis angaria]